MAWMGIWWVLGAVVIAGLFWAMVTSARGPRGGGADSPERILKRRYAKGEIDHDTTSGC